MTLFLLQMPKIENPKSEEKENKWDSLDCLPHPYGPRALLLNLLHSGSQRDYRQIQPGREKR
jgi:hypothetical protein